MTTIRQHIADVLRAALADYGVEARDAVGLSGVEMQTDALLADPVLAAILDFAADPMIPLEFWHDLSDEVQALLQDWRANR